MSLKQQNTIAAFDLTRLANDNSLAVRPSNLLLVRRCHELSCQQHLFEKSGRHDQPDRVSWADVGAAARKRCVQCGTVAIGGSHHHPSIQGKKTDRVCAENGAELLWLGWAGHHRVAAILYMNGVDRHRFDLCGWSFNHTDERESQGTDHDREKLGHRESVEACNIVRSLHASFHLWPL